MPVWIIFLVMTLYISGLFFIAWKAEKYAKQAGASWRRHPIIYSLALGVYCTSWTFFGAVGSAAINGWYFLPIYIGPIILYLFWPSILQRIADVSKRESINSLSDFLASRYGRSRLLAAIATGTLTIVSLPYIALQLKSVGMSFQAITIGHTDHSATPADQTVLVAAIGLAIFAVLFGARYEDATKPNYGLMNVLAFEAIVKLVALIAVAILGIVTLSGLSDFELSDYATKFDTQNIQFNFLSTTLLSMAAMVCLPRQFHVAIIERRTNSEMKLSRIVLPLYLLLTSLVVIPITIAGLHLFPSNTPTDLFVLLLPQATQLSWLTVLVFIGGFSAATGMIVVAAIALSTMITNDLIVPVMLKFKTFDTADQNIGSKLLNIRRTTILILLLFGYLFYQAFGDRNALMDIGLLSFSGAAQLFPALVGAVYWRKAHRNGAMAGILAGCVLWAYTLVLPAIFGPEWMMDSILPPSNFFGIDALDSLSHGVFWSLSINTLLFVLLSLRAKERLRDRVQANVFREKGLDSGHGKPVSYTVKGVSVGDLQALASRFLKPSAVSSAFSAYAEEIGVDTNPSVEADWRLVQRTERLLSSALGSSSARVVLGSAITRSDVTLDDLLSILDEKSHAKRFDRHLLQATLENISLGVSVVDGEQKLVAWNSAYIKMFDLPDELVQVGRPIADIIKWTTKNGTAATDEKDAEVSIRLAHIKEGRSHTYERQRPDGTTIKTIGNPMPGGGYVSTFTDVSEDKAIEKRLREAKENLEIRVVERTSELENLTQELDGARREAEGANASKTRFLAAASHDLLQPLNAARLFTGAVQSHLQGTNPEALHLVGKIDQAIQSSDQLLRGLLDISKLDHGVRDANYASLSLGALFSDIGDEADPIAKAAGLRFKLVPTTLGAYADEDFLKSIVRNFVSNALRYTRSGGVLVGARRRGGKIRIEVWDTGVGIPASKQNLIFEEFQRLEEADRNGIRGAGLGLAIANRMAGLMGASVGLRSWENKGSVFFVDLLEAKSVGQIIKLVPKEHKSLYSLEGVRVLCVDDEPTILDGMEALLVSWGCVPFLARSGDEAAIIASSEELDFAFLDYHLLNGESGFDVREKILSACNYSLPAALLTAEKSEYALNRAKQEGLAVFKKPVSPRDLQAYLAGIPIATE